MCDSRAIPNEIDGLKPVQRRILWTMWNSVAKNLFTKTVKVTGLVMGYHPHGDASINDTIAGMAQQFTFANNYALIAGEGTFGDVLDPKAIASPRYTEVRLSEFAKDAGFFESIPDIEYMPNYDETTKEPVFFVPKVPVVLLNSTMGIATGFRCSIPGRKLTDVVNGMIEYLKKKKTSDICPWYIGYQGKSEYWFNPAENKVFTTGFGIKKKEDALYIVSAPQGWNREKVIEYLDEIVSDKEGIIRNYLDHSRDTWDIELVLKKGETLTVNAALKILDKTNNDVIAQNMITSAGRLEMLEVPEVIANFCEFRKKHLIRRFKRLAGLEEEKIARNSELIRFLQEEWNLKVTNIKNKADFEDKLKKAKYKFFEWLSSIPVYRMTTEEVGKCREAIVEAEKMLKYYNALSSSDTKLTAFIIEEITELAKKYDK